MAIKNDSVILVTGAHGFLGHHVVEKLEEYRIGGTNGARRNIKILTPNRTELNLLDSTNVECYMMSNKPDIIIHLAGTVGGIGLNKEKPGTLTYENLQMGLNLIEISRQCTKLAKFVCIGTTCSYPLNCPVPFKEEDFLEFNRSGPGMPEATNAGYGLAKRMLYELLCNYNKQYEFPFIYLIPVNMVGEWDNFDDDSSHVIPAMLKKFHRAKLEGAPSVTLWGDGSASREFLNARDCADAILRATLLYDSPEPVNIGTGEEVTIRELAEKVRKVVGYEGKVEWDTTKPNGQPRRQLDVSRARTAFGFVASISLDETLREAYEWYCNEYC